MIDDPTGAMAGKTFQVTRTASAVTLTVVAAVAAVPEPGALALAACGLVGFVVASRRRVRSSR